MAVLREDAGAATVLDAIGPRVLGTVMHGLSPIHFPSREDLEAAFHPQDILASPVVQVGDVFVKSDSVDLTDAIDRVVTDLGGEPS